MTKAPKEPYELYPIKPSKPTLLEFLGKYDGKELFQLVTGSLATIGATSIIVTSFIFLPWGVSIVITAMMLVAALLAILMITDY